jgi:hypothetical protein
VVNGRRNGRSSFDKPVKHTPAASATDANKGRWMYDTNSTVALRNI